MKRDRGLRGSHGLETKTVRVGSHPCDPCNPRLRTSAFPAFHPRCSTDTNARGDGPVYSAVGRMSLRLLRCSRMCAAQPAMRAKTKIGVNIGVGTPRK